MKLIPGFTHVARGTASYRGALRVTPSSVPRWVCKHDHLTAKKATECAQAELNRREQGAREVFVLLHCEPCSRWFNDPPDGGSQVCPRCEVPVDRVKVAVLERLPS